MPSERPRGELFSDPGAKVVWAGICALDEGTQHQVLAELRQRLGNPDERTGPLARKEARGIGCLRRAADALGRSPSQRAYRDLRNTRPDFELPPDGSVRNWLGGNWNAALERAKLDRVPDTDAETEPLGPRLTDEEILTAVRDCAAELGRVPSQPVYLAWARRPEVRRRPGSRPQSQSPFDRAFGSFPAALEAAGLKEPGVPHVNGRPLRGYGYSSDELFSFLDEVVQRLGGFPVGKDFNRERDRILEERTNARTATHGLPSYNVYHRRFGGWPAARAAYEAWRRERKEDGRS